MSSHCNKTPLHTIHPERRRAAANRLHFILCAAAILLHLSRLFRSLPSSLPLLLADLFLVFMWAVVQAARWRPLRRRQFHHLLSAASLPSLDVFICTADPDKEPPVGVANAALSAMGFDYPPEKLSVYVSDDGCSELTLFAFSEAARFARHWLPFCREMGLMERSPEVYFRAADGGEGEEIKEKYENMKERIERAMERGTVSDDIFALEEDRAIFEKWKSFTRRDHPPVIQVLLDSAGDEDITGKAMPSLVYVSREKSSSCFHHFKAGALNALLRVSGVMSNAPVILTLDCDTKTNDPSTAQRAMCYFLDTELSPKLAYVQFPQRFPSVNEADIYGGEIKRLYQINPRGMDGLKGPNYVGTGCFHSRKSFLGPPSSSLVLAAEFGGGGGLCSLRSEEVIRKAREVACCRFEDGTEWGNTIGVRYGTLSEDYHTGYRQHCEGWESVLCDPDRPAFVCESPITLDGVLTQNKRWCLGALNVFFSKRSPITYGIRNVSFLMGLCYCYDGFWTSWCIPITVYGLVPQLALAFQVPLFPKASDPWFYMYAYLFLVAYFQDLAEFLAAGGTLRRWWNDQRMWLIRGITSYLFGAVHFALTRLGIPAPGFNVTSKLNSDDITKRYEQGMFEFGTPSPFFVSLATISVVNLSSFVVGMAMAATKEGGFNQMFVQLFLSGFGVANAWPVYEAMFLRKDGGRMPWSVTFVSVLLAGALYCLGYFSFY